MRIIGGAFGSRRLKTPAGPDTRPTMDATRESLFNILGAQTQGARVLDLFAGSGALVLEALSRGAASAVFVDASPAAVKAVTQNIASLAVQEQCQVLHMSWNPALGRLRRAGVPFDLVFLDPPYDLAASPVLAALAQPGVLAENATVLLERDKRTPPDFPPELSCVRTKAYGDTRVDFLTYQGGQHGHSDLPGQL